MLQVVTDSIVSNDMFATTDGQISVEDTIV
jgi:hypothetical protein